MQNDSLLNAAKSILTASPDPLEEALGSPWGNPFKGEEADIIWLHYLSWPGEVKRFVSHVNSGKTYQTVHIASTADIQTAGMKPAAKAAKYLLFDKPNDGTKPALVLVK